MSRRILELAGLLHRSDLITEGEDLFGDEGGDEEEGDEEEAGDEEGGEEEGEEGEEGEEEGDEEEEPAEELTPQDIAKHGPGEIEQTLDSLMQGIFDDSLQRARVHSKVSIGYPGKKTDDDLAIEESIRSFSMKCLLAEGEEEDPAADIGSTPEGESPTSEDFDLSHFTSEVARYIKNYTSLLDIEGMLFNKARQFLMSQFGPDLEGDFVEKLSLEHGINFQDTYNPEDSEAHGRPVALGASAAAAGV